MSYSNGKCDNCSRFSIALTTHVEDGATFRDCPDCMSAFQRASPRLTSQVAVDREIQKVWAATPSAKDTVYHAPPVRCSICNVKAPEKYTKMARPRGYPGNLLGADPSDGYLGDITGWMLIEFPVKDIRHGSFKEGTLPAITQFAEKLKLCPKCAKHVTGTITHHKDGYNDND